jgi:hypothetical protein
LQQIYFKFCLLFFIPYIMIIFWIYSNYASLWHINIHQAQGLICSQDRSIHSCVTQIFLCNFIGVVICTPGRNNGIAFCNCLYFLQNIHYFGCWHNAVGIATHCGLDGLGFEPFGDKIFYSPLAYPAFCTKGTDARS